MRDLYFATQNPHKVVSLRNEMTRLVGWRLLTVPFDVPEPRGESVKEIAMAKVRYAQNVLTKTGVVALDAGFYIDELGGFPGAMVNFIIKNPAIGIGGILKLMNGRGRGHRGCRFIECLAFLDPKLAKKPICFVGEIRGELAYKPAGNLQEHHWSELSLIFVPSGQRKALTEMTREEYDSWRREREKSSIHKFVKWLSQF